MGYVQWISTLAGLALLAGCGDAPAGKDPMAAKDPHAMQLMNPGDAQCFTSTLEDAQAAAAATSALRASRGLPPVRASTTLTRAAAAHACDMARRGRMTHIGSTTTGPAQRVKSIGYRPMVTAENIAAGPFSRDRVLHEWNISQGHRANILIPQMREVGIGRAIGPDGKTVFWAAVYSAPR